MKPLILIGLLSAALGPGPTRAQVPSPIDSSAATSEPTLAGLPGIPGLEQVLAAILNESPEVRFESANVRRKEHELTRVSRSWMDQLSLAASAQYGVYGNQTLEQASLGRTVGVGLSVSLFDLFGRGSERGVFRQEVEMARHRVELVRREVEIEVIKAYRRLELAGRLVRIKSEAWHASRTHLQIAELAFSQGDLPISEVARVTEIAAQAESGFESARSEYLSAYGELETLVGAPLNTLL